MKNKLPYIVASQNMMIFPQSIRDRAIREARQKPRKGKFDLHYFNGDNFTICAMVFDGFIALLTGDEGKAMEEFLKEADAKAKRGELSKEVWRTCLKQLPPVKRITSQNRVAKMVVVGWQEWWQEFPCTIVFDPENP